MEILLLKWVQTGVCRCVNVQADKLLQEHEQKNPHGVKSCGSCSLVRTLHICMLYSVLDEPNSAHHLMGNRLGTADFLCFPSPLRSDGRVRRRASKYKQLIQRSAAPAPLWRASKASSALLSRWAKTSNVHQSGAGDDSVLLQPFSTSRFTLNWRYDWLMLFWWKKQVCNPSGWPIFSPFSSVSLCLSLSFPCNHHILVCAVVRQHWPKWWRITRPFIDFDFHDQLRSCFKKMKEA